MAHMPFKALTLAVLCGLLAGCDSPDDNANRLYVDASSKATQSLSEPDLTKQHALLASARDSVLEILEKYPTTNAAVRISANEPIGPYSRTQLDTTIAALAARPELCIPNLTRECLLQSLEASSRNLFELLASEPSEVSRDEIQALSPSFLMLHVLEPARAAALVPDTSQMRDYHAFILENALAGSDTFVPIFEAYRASPSADAVTAIAELVRAIPRGRQTPLDILASAFHTYPEESRTAGSYKDFMQIVGQFANPLPDQVSIRLDNAFCSFPIYPTEEIINLIKADCSPAQLARVGQLPALSNDEYEAMYAAAAEERKKSVADSAYGRKGATVDDMLSWADRSGYGKRIDLLMPLYRKAAEENHPSLPKVLTVIENADQPDSTHPIAQAGVTMKNIILIHAAGQLNAQLPNILQVLNAHPSYSYELESALGYLMSLARFDASIPIDSLSDTVAAVTKDWSEDRSASRSIATERMMALLIDRDNDPKPFLDRLHGDMPYTDSLDYDMIIHLKKHGYPEYMEQRFANSASVTDRGSFSRRILYEEVRAASEAGDAATVVRKLATQENHSQESQLRTDIIKDVFDTRYKTGPLTAEEAQTLEAVIEAYPVDVLWSEMVWLKDYGLPVDRKAELLATHYADVTGRKSGSPKPMRWVLPRSVQIPHDTRLKLVNAAYVAKDPSWPVLATVHVILLDMK